jgi:hypothetical protein
MEAGQGQNWGCNAKGEKIQNYTTVAEAAVFVSRGLSICSLIIDEKCLFRYTQIVFWTLSTDAHEY